MRNGSLPERGLLLDTHAWVWLVAGDARLGPARESVEAAATRGQLYVHAISVWEVAILECKRRLHLSGPIGAWIETALQLQGINFVALDPDVAIAAVRIPDFERGDPADQILAATAHLRSLRLVTADRKLLRLAETGYMRCLSIA